MTAVQVCPICDMAGCHHMRKAEAANRRNTRPGSPGPLTDPRMARDGERIGSGFIVFRRGKGSGRLRCPEYPFEHPSLAAAQAERDRLASLHPGETFLVFVTAPGDDG